MHRHRLGTGERERGRRRAVLVYHSIGSVPRGAPGFNGFIPAARFAAQMAYLAEHRRVVALDDLFDPAPEPGPPRVAITFDDAYRSAFDHAVPVLRALGLAATFFVATKWIGGRNVWDRPSDLPLDLMTPEQLVELDESGFAVESHGHAHIDYARADPRGGRGGRAGVGGAADGPAGSSAPLSRLSVRPRLARSRRRGGPAEPACGVHARPAAADHRGLRVRPDAGRPRRPAVRPRPQERRVATSAGATAPRSVRPTARCARWSAIAGSGRNSFASGRCERAAGSANRASGPCAAPAGPRGAPRRHGACDAPRLAPSRSTPTAVAPRRSPR